jgi:hypothetical protein
MMTLDEIYTIQGTLKMDTIFSISLLWIKGGIVVQ